ncbi:hypothetical protein IAU60_004762 [Kwoniella sp. DSM 27419]
MTMSQDFVPNLERARELIAELLAHIRGFPLDRLLYHAPILDRIRFEGWDQDEVMGLKKWVEGVSHHAKVLDGMAQSPIPPKEDPLPSVQGLITFWKIVVTSPPPIVGLRMGMGGEKRMALASKANKGKSVQVQNGAKGKHGDKEVWVDVVADGGRQWVRIYSKKISHLLAEFREADSYINSDFDSDSSGGEDGDGRDGDGGGGNTTGDKGTDDTFTNSLMITARELHRTVHAVERIPGTDPARLIIQLTRIPETPEELNAGYGDSVEEGQRAEWPDSRIPETFARVRAMGIDLVFTDLSTLPLSGLRGCPRPTVPTPALRFNLDITTLMGLCSDVLHYPLPKTKAEAAGRSLRPVDHLIGTGSASRGRDGTGKGKGKGKKEDEDLQDEDEDLRGQSQNSRELYRCILEEMERPFFDELATVIKEAQEDWRKRRSHANDTSNMANPPPVEFWTTRQAAQYTYEALSAGPAHGYGGEQRRMRRMLGLEEGDFFAESRYEADPGVFAGFRVRVFDVDQFEPGPIPTPHMDAGPGNQKEARQESETDGDVPRTGFHRTLAAVTQRFLDQYYAAQAGHSATVPNFLQPKKMPSPPIAKITLPFPVVSLHSLHRGAHEGITTLMMGTATLKEVWSQVSWRVRGWERGWYDWEGGFQEGQEPGRREKGHAAVMIFPYRVFGEGKRVRFEQGDYSYPSRD